MKLTFEDESKENRASFVMGRCFNKCFSGGGLSGDETKELVKAFEDCLEVKRKRECSNINEYRRIEIDSLCRRFCIDLLSSVDNKLF